MVKTHFLLHWNANSMILIQAVNVTMHVLKAIGECSSKYKTIGTSNEIINGGEWDKESGYVFTCSIGSIHHYELLGH